MPLRTIGLQNTSYEKYRSDILALPLGANRFIICFRGQLEVSNWNEQCVVRLFVGLYFISSWYPYVYAKYVLLDERQNGQGLTSNEQELSLSSSATSFNCRICQGPSGSLLQREKLRVSSSVVKIFLYLACSQQSNLQLHSFVLSIITNTVHYVDSRMFCIDLILCIYNPFTNGLPSWSSQAGKPTFYGRNTWRSLKGRLWTVIYAYMYTFINTFTINICISTCTPLSFKDVSFNKIALVEA